MNNLIGYVPVSVSCVTLCVHTCILVCADICIFVHICMCSCVGICASLCMSICVCEYVSECMNMCLSACVFCPIVVSYGPVSLPVQTKHYLLSHPLRPDNLLTPIDISLCIFFCFEEISSVFFLFLFFLIEV